MNSKTSSVLFLSTFLFVVSSFASSTIYSGLERTDAFGYPFVFFTANALETETSFNVLAFLSNVSICIGLAYFIVTIVRKVKAFGKPNQLRTYP